MTTRQDTNLNYSNLDEDTKILLAVEASDGSWWGYTHSEPASTSRHPPLNQLIPTHIALRGSVPKSLIAQAITITGDRCPCSGEPEIITVPVGATLPTGTTQRHGTLGELATAYADAG